VHASASKRELAFSKIAVGHLASKSKIKPFAFINKMILARAVTKGC
jgi:hypothetical protein